MYTAYVYIKIKSVHVWNLPILMKSDVFLYVLIHVHLTASMNKFVVLHKMYKHFFNGIGSSERE